MDSLNEEDKNALIDRLLRSNQNPKENNSPETNENPMMNLTPEQLDLLSKMYASGGDYQAKSADNKNFKSFLPDPGFCLKTKNSKEEKVFINVCKSSEINAPRDITEQELLKLIEQHDVENAAFQFRVPMSLGEPHSEMDNSSCACTAYDVCINSDFFKKINESSTFMGFFMSIVIEGLENKYSIKLDRNCKMLKNKKFHGKIQEQYVRVKSKPLIAEVDSDNKKSNTAQDNTNKENQPVESKDKMKAQTPKYKIIREPAEGDVEFLVAEIELPQIISAKSLLLDIGEDRILLNTRSGIYHLDMYLAYRLNQDECGAQFDKKSKLLTITVPVLPN